MHATPKPDHSLPRSRILRRRSDFLQLKREGLRSRSPALTCNWMTGQTSAMVAFIIPKNCGPAVIRNRIRRRLKELFRHLQPHLPSDARIVWIAHPPAAQMTLAQLAIEFLRLVHRAGLMPRDQGYPPEVAHRWKISDSPRS